MSHRSRRAPEARLRPAVCAALLAAALSGCVTSYQPLVGLQRPVVVDPAEANFQGARIRIRCLTSEDFDSADAQMVCRRLGRLFGNQGAQVETEVPRPKAPSALESDPSAPRPDLAIQVSSRTIHLEDPTLLWVASAITYTLVPAVTDTTVAMDVVVRDADGFLLASETYQARFVRHFGAGIWAVNGLLNLLVRSDEEEISDEAASKDFSRDLYGQLSQLAFHAQMRAKVLRQFQPPATAAK